MKKSIFKLEKKVFDLSDFEKMSFHDVQIYGISKYDTTGEGFVDLLFDIDMIFKWINPVKPKKSFEFWIAPCTLVFKYLSNLKVAISENYATNTGFEINNLVIVDKKNIYGDVVNYSWKIDFHNNGVIEFNSNNFQCYVRRKPLLCKVQSYPYNKRGGVDFSLKYK